MKYMSGEIVKPGDVVLFEKRKWRVKRAERDVLLGRQVVTITGPGPCKANTQCLVEALELVERAKH